MRGYGWCESCHRIKRINISTAAMAMMMSRGVATGICQECEDKKGRFR